MAQTLGIGQSKSMMLTSLQIVKIHDAGKPHVQHEADTMIYSLDQEISVKKVLFLSLMACVVIVGNSSSADNLDARVDFALSALAPDDGRLAKIDFSVQFNALTLCAYARQFGQGDLLPTACTDLDDKTLKTMRASAVCDEGGSQNIAACLRRLSELESAAALATSQFIQAKASIPEVAELDSLNHEYSKLLCDLDSSLNGGVGIYVLINASSCRAEMLARHRYALSKIVWAVQR